MFDFKKSHPVGSVRVEKRGNEFWSNMRSFSFQKNDLLFVILKSRSKYAYFQGYSRTEQFAGHNCDKKMLNLQPSQSRKWLYH